MLQFQKQCYEDFAKLSEAKKKEYQDQADFAAADYTRKVKEFYAQNPGLGWAAQNKKLCKDGKKMTKDTIYKLGLPNKRELFKDQPTPPQGPQSVCIVLNYRV